MSSLFGSRGSAGTQQSPAERVAAVKQQVSSAAEIEIQQELINVSSDAAKLCIADFVAETE